MIFVIFLAHELSHAILHCNNDLFFLHDYMIYNRMFFEKKEDVFDSELLINLDNIDNYIQHYTYFDIANYFNVPIELAKLKLNIPY